MNKGEKKEFQKGELRIIAIYSGEHFFYETDFNDPDYEDGRDLYADEIEEIEISFPGIKDPVRLSRYLPQGVTFVHSPELGDGYHELNGRNISFNSLTEKGGLLGLLHEMGHANVDDRYQVADGSKADVLKERHAWGWALLLFKELKRQGIDLELQMDEIAIKEFIKDSLLGHEISARATDNSLHEEVTDHGYWSNIKDEDLDRVVDDLYDNPRSNFRDFYPNSEELKRTIRLPKK